MQIGDIGGTQLQGFPKGVQRFGSRAALPLLYLDDRSRAFPLHHRRKAELRDRPGPRVYAKRLERLSKQLEVRLRHASSLRPGVGATRELLTATCLHKCVAPT